MMPEYPPIQVPSWALGAVPVACVGGIDFTGRELQDLLGGPAPGVWVGLDMKQLRGEAEVWVLRGRGNVDLELGWGERSAFAPAQEPPSPSPTLSGLQGWGSDFSMMPSSGCPSGAKARSHPRLLYLASTFDQLYPQDPRPHCHHVPHLTHYLSYYVSCL